jgi:hypothetical protein
MSALSTMERVVEIVTRLLIYPAPRFGDPENGERKNIGEKRGGVHWTQGVTTVAPRSPRSYPSESSVGIGSADPFMKKAD